VFEFFVTASELSAGTVLAEAGLRAGTQLMTRSLISPTYTTIADTDYGIEYTVSLGAPADT
jgi:hypothetical protein